MSDSAMITWEAAVEKLRDDPEKRQLVRDCYYDDPLLEAADRYWKSEEWEHIQRLLPSCGSVLDLGAGRGISSFAFARDGWQVTALEPDPSNIVGAGAIRSLADEAGLQVDIVESWGEELPFPSGSFDLVFGRAVFHHAAELDKFCAEVERVLVPNGVFLITREHVISRDSDLPEFLESHPLHQYYGGEAAYRLDQYLAAIEKAGLKIEKVLGPKSTPINYFPISSAEMQTALIKRRRRRMGAIGALISSLKSDSLRREALHWESELNHPGRLYSFMARKPFEP